MKNIFVALIASISGFILHAPVALAAAGAFPVETGFLSISQDQLSQKAEAEHGVDLAYEPSGTLEKLVSYDKIMVDQPEVWLDQDSEYRGMKPDNAKTIADLIRSRVTDNMSARGFEVVEEPGPGVLYLRLALTDLYLKKKKRGILSYTPAGAVMHAGTGLLKDMMGKVDIIEMALQAELQDSQTGEVLAAMVIKRGARKDREAGQKLERMDFEEFTAVLQKYGNRFSCRLENARLPELQQKDCLNEE